MFKMQFVVLNVLFLNYVLCFVNCYSFNNNNVLRIGDFVRDAYFSYKLLLQRGEGETTIIVGAPRKDNSKLGGDIYKCSIDLNGGSTCVPYLAGKNIPSNTTNGNYFGMSLDGDDNVNGAFVACAPRTVTSKIANYLRGYCVYMRNSSQLYDNPIEITPLENNGLYHDSACCDASRRPYYDFAFSMAGFDVSYYSKKKPEVLLGAPGVKKFNGATISYSIEDQGISLLPTREKPVQADEDTYFGYSVSTGKFSRYVEDVWFVAGAPRANGLKGKVTIYYYVMTKERMSVVATFYGEEVGSYFGASVLALDVSNDGILDLLIGAPMVAGKTWDEGAVYFYRGLNSNLFQQGIKLTGSKKIGSRFGSAIVSLGDFDLDGFDDVAISAPYEDNGIGAVYIYKGGPEGLTNEYSQRISPTDLNGGFPSARGFGLGISRGNDIDGNGHNDIAVGAYKSDDVYVIKSFSIIDYQFLLRPSINIITNESTFGMQFCLLYTKRSDKPILSQVNFNISIEMDYRAVESKIIDHIQIELGLTFCKEYQVRIRNTVTDISPFQIDLKLETDTTDIIAHGERSLEINIPYSHGCGNDNVCETDLTLDLNSTSEKLILGLNKQINLAVIVNNYGEPAYQCEVKFFEVPEGIELRNLKDCNKNDKNYTCVIDERLIVRGEKEFIFDVRNLYPGIQVIGIAAEVTSLGINKVESRNKANINIPVILDSTPFIISKSTPENAELEIKNTHDIEVVYQFSIGKSGPSPLGLDVDILLPVLEHDGESIFNALEVKGHIDNVQVPCVPISSKYEDETYFDSYLDDSKVPLNRSLVVFCDTKELCLRYKCQGEYLYDSAKTAVFDVKASIRSKLLISKYKSELITKDIIAFLPIALQSSPTGRVGASSLFLIFVHGVHIVPLWLYIIAPTVGVILLLLLSYGLYKCHFFDRVYKDKLEQEKILGSNDGSIEEDIFDDVVFHPEK